MSGEAGTGTALYYLTYSQRSGQPLAPFIGNFCNTICQKRTFSSLKLGTGSKFRFSIFPE